MKRFWLVCMMGVSLNGMAQANNNTNAPSTTNNSSKSVTPVAVDTVHFMQERVAKPAKEGKVESKRKTQAEINREEELNIAPPTTENDNDGVSDTKDLELAVPAATIHMQQQFEFNQTNSTHQYSRRSASPEEQMEMDQSVKYYNANVPGSFESHFYTYLAGHYNWALYPELEAAAKLEPYNQEVIQQQAAYFVMTEKSAPALEAIDKLIASNKLTTEHLSYAKDVLISGMDNGVVVFHGFEDMLSAYYVQQKEHIRNDVKLLSLDFLQSTDYKNAWTKTQSIHFPFRTQIDTTYLREMCEMNPLLNVQIAMTVPRDYFLPMKSKLYPVGLTFLYSEVPVDYYERNKQLWYDHLKQTIDWKFNTLYSRNLDTQVGFTGNYLPMMITLSDQLQKAGEVKKAEELKHQIELMKP